MTKLGLRPYQVGDAPLPASVPVSVVVLALNEELNIYRCLASAAWADQILVIDSGSTDDTTRLASSLGAEVIDQPWLGFSKQREFVLSLPQIRHDWIYFLDADEWVSPQLAAEISEAVRAPSCSAFTHRLRLVFQGTWIRHCGWYQGSWVVRLVDRRHTRYDGNEIGERAQVDGPIHRMRNDIVDDDQKGLEAWLHKHVGYARLEAQRRASQPPLSHRLRTLKSRQTDTRPLVRAILKDVVYPFIPLKPLALFIFMYFLRLGFVDGRAGLRFCFYHAWFEVSISAMQASQDLANNRKWHNEAKTGRA